MTHTARSPVVVTVEQRRAEVARMRRDGSTLDAIAAAFGCSKRTVQRDIDAMLAADRDAQAATTAEHRAELLDNLDAIAERCWLELDNDPSPAAVAAICSTLTRTYERIAALTGADAPQRHVIANADAPPEHSIAGLYCRLPVRAIERARTAANEQFDRAIELRLASDAATAERVASMRTAAPDTAEPELEAEPVTVEPAALDTAEPAPDPDEPDEPVPVVPADRRTARALDRAARAAAETDAAVQSWRRANRVTGANE